MKSDSIEGKILQSLEGLRGELDPCRREEAVATMGAARPASRGWTRRVAAALAAAIVLVGVGFIPVPLGRTKGMLDKAMAAATNATTVHIVTRYWWGPNRTMQESQEWLAEDFGRMEHAQNGDWITDWIAQGPWETRTIIENGSVKQAMSIYDPCRLHPAHLPDRATFMRQFDVIRWKANRFHYPVPELNTQEHLERSLWGGELAVVEAFMAVSREQAEYNPEYAGADQILFRAEIDPNTNALLSQREYKVKDGDRHLLRERTYEWNVEIPDELRQFRMPPRTKLERSSWWETRAGKVLANDSTPVWQVTLHTIDAARNGDLILSISRVVTPEGKPLVFNSAPVVRVEAVGDGGEEYTQDRGFGCMNARSVGYWNTSLHAKDPTRHPKTITLTIWPYDADPCKDQSVTFRDVPLPPRQDAEDVKQIYDRAREVIQH